MTNAQRIGGILVLGGAAALLYLWWKRRKSPAATAPAGPLTNLSQGFQDYLLSFNVAPKQPATPNTPTVDPVFADVKGGSSTSAPLPDDLTLRSGSTQAGARGSYL